MRPARRRLAARVRDAEKRGVLDLKTRHLAAFPLTVADAGALKRALETDDGLDAYVDDARRAVARVKAVDLTKNDLARSSVREFWGFLVFKAPSGTSDRLKTRLRMQF